jgi:hypothetical protein
MMMTIRGVEEKPVPVDPAISTSRGNAPGTGRKRKKRSEREEIHLSELLMRYMKVTQTFTTVLQHT